MSRKQFHIIDWTGKVCFSGQRFESFEDGEEFLCIMLDENYETDRCEYYVELVP